MEKLLRSCPGIKNIYLLLRTKKGLDARQRIEELFNAKVSIMRLALGKCRNDEPGLHNWPCRCATCVRAPQKTHAMSNIRFSQRQLAISTQIFDRVKEANPKALHKVIPIQGDIAMPGLGISESDQLTLTNEVSVVFHSAATVKFDEPLR